MKPFRGDSVSEAECGVDIFSKFAGRDMEDASPVEVEENIYCKSRWGAG